MTSVVGSMAGDLQEKWDKRYREGSSPPAASPVLVENRHLLPRAGQALDLACGLGANALLLSAEGLETRAWDLSPVAVQRLEQFARQRGLPVRAEVRDVVRHPPEPLSLDVIVVTHFLERGLVPDIIAALRPRGLVFYQTFTKVKVDDCGPDNPDYRLDENELLRLFSGLHVLVYREEGTTGDVGRGWRNEAMLVGRKRG